jgi:DNA ligase-1
MPFHLRRELLNTLFRGQKKVKNVPTYVANNREQIDHLYKTFVEFGFEGAMIRNQNSLYKPDKRSDDLLKFKKFFDEDFKIVCHEEDKNGHAVFFCVTKDGTPFKVKPTGSDEERREYLENAERYYGQMMTVKFFEWTSSANPVPRFPVGIIRDYE